MFFANTKRASGSLFSLVQAYCSRFATKKAKSLSVRDCVVRLGAHLPRLRHPFAPRRAILEARVQGNAQAQYAPKPLNPILDFESPTRHD